MSLWDWLIVIVPVAFVMGMGLYSSRFVCGVSDFLAAGRVCGRYVLTTGSMANTLGLVTLIAFIEVEYRTGFALGFWGTLRLPIAIMLSLTGWCLYRYRETRAMSLGQYLEMRYSRRLRIFACFLRSAAEMMANIIMPALAARFFIVYLGLPQSFSLFGVQIPTFILVILITLTLAISLICIAGTLSIVITDTLQCLICLPLIVTFIIFIFAKFSWSNEIVQVMCDRVAGESFLDPFDVAKLRDFNLFMLIVQFIASGMHTASGVTGTTSSARSAHESKMASILGTWRSAFTTVFYVVIAIAIITLMNHRDFAGDAKIVRDEISRQAALELEASPQKRAELIALTREVPVADHVIGRDAPLSGRNNLDEPYFQAAQKHFGLSGEGSSKTQQFKTLFRQMMLPAAMRHMLPAGLTGLFCLMIILFIISTDDSRIYSAASTLVQDCVVPFYKAEKLTPEVHVRWIRGISIGVGLFFLMGSFFMAQLDYVNLFISIMYGMWLGGCGPMIVFGFYSRFGTTAGAWVSLLSGMSINVCGALAQRNWADVIYPWLERSNWVEPVGNFLAACSKPFHPYVVWEMNRLKFPINSYEIYFLAMMISLLSYVIVSKLTCRTPFNLERMLHRGKYATEGVKNLKSAWTWRSVWGKLIGITPEYSFWDKVIAWSVFSYSIIYKFFLIFVCVVIWNAFFPWPLKWWGNYFLIVSLVIPCIAAAFTTVWFGIGGYVDLRRMFRDLRNRVENPLDNGMVEGNLSLADKKELEDAEKKS